jgi:cytochrome c oxidase subunit II
MPRRSRLLPVIAVLSLALVAVLYVALVAGSFDNDGKPLSWLAPAGPSAQSIFTLSWPVFLVAGFVGVFVLGGIMYIALRFRGEDDEDLEEFPDQVHGKTALEIGWTVAPAVILAFIAVFTVVTILDLEDRKDDAIQVQVVGNQWWWRFEYDANNDGEFNGEGDFATAGELVVPAGREIDLVMTSNDVIHSFWIPQLNGKRDTVPGMDTFWKLEADEPGVYRGQCTEFCGLSHANMRMVVRALPPDDYDRWFENQVRDAQPAAADSQAAAGEEVFAGLCAQCHVVRGQFEEALGEGVPLVSGAAPDLTKFATRGTFAGSIFNLYEPQAPGAAPGTPGDASDVSLTGDPGDALYGGEPGPFRLNRPALEAWLRNPPAMKAMAPDEERGMPNLGLTEEQIDQLVAYLETLK